MPSVPPLWKGYDTTTEPDLLDQLSAKVKETLDPATPTDERVTREFAQAISSHEWLNRRDDSDNHHPELYQYAREISTQEVGSWRPRTK